MLVTVDESNIHAFSQYILPTSLWLFGNKSTTRKSNRGNNVPKIVFRLG